MQKYIIDTERPEALLAQELNRILKDIDVRLNDLEHRTSKTRKKQDITRAQKMLLMHHLGLLEKLKELNISNKKIAAIISLLINSSQDNIEGDLSDILNPNSDLKTGINYEFLIQIMDEINLKKLKKEMVESLQLIGNKAIK